MERSETLRERTERNLEASSERRFRSRQARTIAQMLRFLRQERGRTSG